MVQEVPNVYQEDLKTPFSSSGRWHGRRGRGVWWARPHTHPASTVADAHTTQRDG